MRYRTSPAPRASTLALSFGLATALCCCGGTPVLTVGGGDAGAPDLAEADMTAPLPAWLSSAQVLVPGIDLTTKDCRSMICRHNENTDLTSFQGSIYFVHRTAQNQVLGPNSALHIYRSTDGAARFTEVALIPAPMDAMGGRDIRDPHFFQIGGKLFVKALTRLPVTSARDSGVDTVAVITSTSDGNTWTPIKEAGPHGWSFWRPREWMGVWYSAAYQDGDKSVVLYSTVDGEAWTRVADVYTVSADTPLETELTFMPSGRVLALVRMDGTDVELLGGMGRLRTNVCWADSVAAPFHCTQTIMDQRLDGPLSFLWKGRLFEIARKHLSGLRKRTSLFELTGNLEGGPLAIKEWGELPSAGDTAYAGAVALDDHRYFVTWYSGELDLDENWVLGILDATDIRSAIIDLSKLQ